MFIALACFTVLVFFGSVVYYFTDNPESSKPLTPLIIGYNYWPGVLPLFVAEEKGLFENEDLKVELRAYEDYFTLLDDLSSGKIDLASDVVLVDAIKGYLAGDKITVIGVSDYSQGADGLVVNNEIVKISDLRGKTIAVEKDTVGEYLLFAILQRGKLDFSQVVLADLSASKGVDAFLENKVDAVVTYEPDLSRAQEKDQSRLLVDSKDFSGLISDVITVNTDYAYKNQASLKAFLKAYFKGVDYIKSNPEETGKIGSNYFKIMEAEFNRQLSGVKILDYDENIQAMSYSGGLKSAYGSGKYLADLLLQFGKISQSYAWEDLINPIYLNILYRP